MYPWAVYSIHRLGNSYFSAFITSKVLRWPPWLGWPLWNICVINDHGYVTLVVNTFWSFLHSWPITGFVTRLIRRVPLVEQELLTLPNHRRSPLDFSGVCCTRFLVLCACFVDLFLSFWNFSFSHCVVCPSSIYRFWLPLWYLQTLLNRVAFLLTHRKDLMEYKGNNKITEKI
jgi:hypothetical protein